MLPSEPLQKSGQDKNKKHREKKKQIQEGTYVKTLYEEAKEEVLKFEKDHIANMKKVEKFANGLSVKEFDKLQTYVYNQNKVKSKKPQPCEATIEVPISKFQEKAMTQQNQQIQNIHMLLIFP